MIFFDYYFRHITAIRTARVWDKISVQYKSYKDRQMIPKWVLSFNFNGYEK